MTNTNIMKLLGLIAILCIITFATKAYASIPEQPTGLTATSVSTTQVNLKWSAPTNDGGSPITSYKIERESPTGSGFSTLVANTGNSTTAYSDTGLSSGTQYNYRVFAVNADGQSTFASNEASNEPRVTITSTVADPTTLKQIPMVAQFSENMTGVNATKFIVGNGVLGGFVEQTLSRYTFTITTDDYNTLSVIFPASSALGAFSGLNNTEGHFNISVIPTSGNWCSGDCMPPTIGLDSSGRRMVDWPVIYQTNTLRFSQLADYFHTPMNDFTVKVGDVNKLQFVVYDNSGFDAIRQIGLSIGVPFTGTFNDGAAQLRWYSAPIGQVPNADSEYIDEVDPNDVFELVKFDTERVECSQNTIGNDNCMGVTIQYKFREAPKDTAVRLDIWDERLNAFQHVLNEGITVQGDSLNGPHVFQAMANNGIMYTLTTNNDFATDQNGDRWSLIDGFWSKDLKPVVNETENLRQANLSKEEDKAKASFDSSIIQKEPKPIKDFIPEHYERLHDPVPNMIKAYIDYAKKQAGHS